MRADFPDKEALDQGFRFLMRSRHIYILFSALIHVALGLYFVRRVEAWRHVVQYIGSAILILSSILLVTAFARETYAFAAYSDISRFGIYSSLFGVGLHLIAALGPRKRDGG